MSLFVWECALACGLLVPAQDAPAKVQPATAAGDLFALYDFIGFEAAPVVLAQVGAAASPRPAGDEEIEVMRALLLRKLTDAVGRNSGAQNLNRYMGTLDAATVADEVNRFYYPIARSVHGPNSDIFSVEGTHLDGFGVVFAVTAHARARHDPQAGAASPTPAPLSDWERARRQLQGESVQEQRKPAPAVPPLSDVLLRLLADNGKHFTRLRDDERLTVVVTFRGPRADALPLATFTSQNQPNAGNPLSVSGNTIAFGTGSGTVNVADGGTLTFNAAAPQTARDLELLGDLHQKQGQLSQAIDAFTKAVTAFRGEWTQQYVQLKDEDQRFQESLKALRRLGELQSKLAQAQIATGQLDLAARTLEALQRDKDQANQTAARKPAPAAKATGANLPARLTVSATKRQLDLVGSGKMSFEEFRKEAKVEFHPAAGADKPAAGGEKK